MIHLKPGASEGPFLTLFQRNLIVAFQEIDPEIVKTTMKYFLKHASQWLFWKNVALSVYAEVAPYSAEAVKACPFPATVDVCSLLQDRTTRLRHFFTMKSREALPILPSSTSTQTFENPSTTTTGLLRGKLANLKV